MKEKISILIPTYNGGSYLKKQLNLFIKECDNKKFKNFISIIILNNCSTDNTEAIVMSYKKKLNKNYYVKIKYFKNKINYGYYKNFLNILKYAESEYICYLVDHDVPTEGFYNELFEKFSNRKSNELIFLPMNNFKSYNKNFYRYNQLSYVFERGSVLTGCVLKRDKISLQLMEQTLYPQNIIYINYFLKYGMNIINFKKKIINEDKNNNVDKKFYDRMERGKDFAVLDKFKCIYLFYKNNKINLFEYILLFYKIYCWSMIVKFSLHKKKKYKIEKEFFITIIKSQNKMLLLLCFLLILFAKNKRKEFIFYIKSCIELFR